MDEAKRLITVCLDKEEPFCASACPFHYDTREFAARLRRGSFNAAFRLFANAVGFPSIVTALCDEPCKSACPRTKTDAAIELRRLERAALDHAANIKPNSYNLPPKDIKIAVIGAGLEGLGCALRLCNRKYQITLFEKSGRIGGSLWDKLPPEVFLNDIETQFMYEQYTLRLNEEIDGPETLSGDFDYVYMAAGAGSAGLSDMEKLAKGLRAAALIEGYLKTGVMKPDEPHKPTRMKLDPAALSRMDSAITHQNPLSKEEAVTEAKRCIGCRCDACYRHCAMMAYFDKFPSRIADEVAVTVNPGTLDGNGTVATRLISTCNQCGLCAAVCPEDIDVGAFLRMSHSVMREKGAMPWAFHDFWLRDMAHAKGPEYAFHGLSDKTGKNPRYLFFPGCQLAASEPRYATGTYRLLLRATSDTAIALGCCGAPAIWAGDMPLAEQVFAEIKEIWESYNRPVFILACPSCRSMFAQYLPEIETVFLLDHLSDMGIKPAVSPEAADIAVFDPCAARGEEKTRAAVRSVAAQAGYTVHELPHSGTAARCCSFGGQIDAANPPYKDWLVKQRAEESPLPYLVYCANCRDVFAGVGKKAVHALELFEGCGRKSENAPGIEARLQNRRRTKGDIMKEFFPGRYAPDEEKPGGPILYLEAGLEEKLDRERIFLADIAAVIKSCEESRRRLLTAEGHYVGHAEAGYMTYWVEYMPEDGGYRIFNAYGHRMRIEQDER